MKRLESAVPVTETREMDSIHQFHALEVMSRERAAVARKEMEYWLSEAEEWAQLRKADTSLAPPDCPRFIGNLIG
jgi:hypothetical protein